MLLPPAQSSFHQFDRDRSGALDRGEVHHALTAAGGPGCTGLNRSNDCSSLQASASAAHPSLHAVLRLQYGAVTVRVSITADSVLFCVGRLLVGPASLPGSLQGEALVFDMSVHSSLYVQEAKMM